MKKDAMANKKLIVFDLDGTLTPSKSNLEPEMSRALGALLARKKVAVIGGGSWMQFRKQFLGSLAVPKDLLGNLFLFPTTATSFYRYRQGWKKIYAMKFSARERREIMLAFRDAFREVGYVPPKKVYGKVIEDRGSQITFSALGQDVVARLGKRGIALKERWRREHTPEKLALANALAARLPDLEVHPSAFTSIDITKKGIDKAYGIRQIERYLRVPIRDMLFIGDALAKGGNDAPVKTTGVAWVAVRGPEETERVIAKVLAVSS
jgi:HAD superfamily hydrolase (TIGR01484 family)